MRTRTLRERERETETETERQTDRQTETDTQTDRQTHREYSHTQKRQLFVSLTLCRKPLSPT